MQTECILNNKLFTRHKREITLLLLLVVVIVVALVVATSAAAVAPLVEIIHFVYLISGQQRLASNKRATYISAKL